MKIKINTGYIPLLIVLLFNVQLRAQDTQEQTQLKLQQALQKKSEYHKATNGEQEGYRIKIHFGIDKEVAETVRAKFQKSFPECVNCLTYREYQQPNFVVLVGDYRSKLEAFRFLNDIKAEFPNAYIIKDKINVK